MDEGGHRLVTAINNIDSSLIGLVAVADDKEWDSDNPLSGIRQFKEGDQELAFLYEEEIERLLSACDQSANKDL